MKRKTSLLIITALIPLFAFPQKKLTRLEKAKRLIRTELKNTMNDYASYSPVSYGKIDSLFTSPAEDDFYVNSYSKAIEAKYEAGLGDIEGLPDVSETIKEMEREPNKYKAGSIENWKIYQAKRDLFYSSLQYFHKKFIGWKLIHKYRGKNTYNATILKEQEFRFDKAMTRIIAVKDVE